MKKLYLLVTTAVMLLTFIFFAGCGLIQGNSGEFYKDKVAVLMYHHISQEESDFTITPAKFEEHLDALLSRGYNVITLSEFRDFLKGEAEVPPNAVLITFDDGYESFYQYAYPLLKERGMSATVFMIVRHIGAREDQIPKIDWSQMAGMIESGMYFQSHSYDSHFYGLIDGEGNREAVLAAPLYLTEKGRNETEEEYRARIYEDLRKSRDLLEQELGMPVDFFAAPYGKKNDIVDEVARKVGLEFIFTVEPGLVSATSDLQSLPRVDAGVPWINGNRLHREILEASRI